ncbi:MAG: hypothetical protein ABJB10_04555 [Mesorhizobium sp.]
MLPARSDWDPRLGVPSVTMPVSRFEPGCSVWTSVEVTPPMVTVRWVMLRTPSIV